MAEKVVINTPAQDKLENEIKALHYQIDELVEFKDSSFATDINLKQLKDCWTSVFEKKKQLNIVIGNARRQREQHKRRSEVLRNIAAESEENAAKLKSFTHEKPGRPSVEDTYPDLHNVIVQIATASSIITQDKWFDTASQMVDYLQNHFQDDEYKEYYLIDPKETAIKRQKTKVGHPIKENRKLHVISVNQDVHFFTRQLLSDDENILNLKFDDNDDCDYNS